VKDTTKSSKVSGLVDMCVCSFCVHLTAHEWCW